MLGFFASIGNHWVEVLVVLAGTALLAYAAFILRNWKLAVFAVVLICWFVDRQMQYSSGYNQRVAVEVAEKTKVLAARVVTLEVTAANDKVKADGDALAIAILQKRITDTPANTKAALPRASVKRIGEVK